MDPCLAGDCRLVGACPTGARIIVAKHASCQMSIANLFDKCLNGLRPLQALACLALEQDCALCGAKSGQALLCTPCRDELPALGARCPRCAMPGRSDGECGRCLRRPPYFDATHSAMRYAFPADRLVLSLKYGATLPIAALLADLLAAHLAEARPLPEPRGAEPRYPHVARQPRPRSVPHSGIDAGIDMVMPMPLHPRRLATRGFNPAVEIGRRVARTLALPFAHDLAQRVRDTPAQADLPLRSRRANVRGAFACSPRLAGCSIAIVDDVMTSGATLDELARALKVAGACRVENWVVARTWPRA
jgi:predicted amidophosphoribosyltransferase